MITSSLIVLKDIVAREEFDSVGDVMKYFKEKYGDITEDFLVAVCSLMHDGYLKGDL